MLGLIEEEGVPVNVENQVSDSETDRRGGSTSQCGEPGKRYWVGSTSQCGEPGK